MPKARRSKKSAKGGNAQSRVTRAAQSAAGAQKSTPDSASPTSANRRFIAQRAAVPQSLIMPGMVALGCWGMSLSFAFFYNDPNHYLFAGMAAMMALLWTYSVFVRFRKLRVARQKGMEGALRSMNR